MELVIKLYQDKPCRLGVKYAYEYLAVRAYEEIISKHKDEVFQLKMEPVRNKLNIQLMSEQTGVTIEYKELEYNLSQLKKLEMLKSAGAILLQFVHVFSKTNTLFVAKPFRNSTFIEIGDFEIVGPGNFGE